MDIFASDDQKMLQEMTRRFVEERAPVSALRQCVEGGGTLDRALWREGAELGWTAVFVPEHFGGIAEHGEGVRDAAVIAEELGRMVFSGPFLPVSVVAQAIAAGGTAAQKAALLPGLVSGDSLAAWCFGGPGRMGGIEASGVSARAATDGWVLDGEAYFVEEAADADLLLVTAQDGKSFSQFVLPAATRGITIEPLDCLDLGRRIAAVRFDHVEVKAEALLGAAGGAADAFESQLQIALVLQCAETVGVATRALEFTLDWLNQRIAFGRVIGSFQAIKHRMAEHATQLEGAKAITAHAARAVRNGSPDAAAAVSMAKSQSGRAAVELIRDCLQFHGGIGMTWDHDIHFYLRRAVSNEALWGSPAAHHERLCRLAGL